MLLEFSVANYRSINELRTFSMQASTGISDAPQENVVAVGNNKVLRSAAIYGANSSGKSNILKAMGVMDKIVITSIKLNDGEELEYDPFMFSTQKEKPTQFEVVFITAGYKYRYGFQLTADQIIEEWLYKTTLKGRTEKPLFVRTEEGIGYDDKLFAEASGKLDMVNENRLFISLCGQLGGKESKRVTNWFSKDFSVISGIDEESYSGFTAYMLHKKREGHLQARQFFKTIKLGFEDLETKEVKIDMSSLLENMPSELKDRLVKQLKGKSMVKLYSIHNIYDNEGNIVNRQSFEFSEVESEGTKKVVELAGPIFDTLQTGGVLAVDELDAKLHPLISQQIVRLFNDPKTNPNNAQLIFNTHDTHLLSSKLLRRDQIWFTEKDLKEQTDLYNLCCFVLPDGSKPRNDANYEKNYIAGRYGAIPYILNE